MTVDWKIALEDPIHVLAKDAGVDPHKLQGELAILRNLFAEGRAGSLHGLEREVAGDAVRFLLDAFDKMAGGGFWGRVSARLSRQFKIAEERCEKLRARLASVRGALMARVSCDEAVAAIEKILAEPL